MSKEKAVVDALQDVWRARLFEVEWLVCQYAFRRVPFEFPVLEGRVCELVADVANGRLIVRTQNRLVCYDEDGNFLDKSPKLKKLSVQKMVIHRRLGVLLILPLRGFVIKKIDLSLPCSLWRATEEFLNCGLVDRWPKTGIFERVLLVCESTGDIAVNIRSMDIVNGLIEVEDQVWIFSETGAVRYNSPSRRAVTSNNYLIALDHGCTVNLFSRCQIEFGRPCEFTSHQIRSACFDSVSKTAFVLTNEWNARLVSSTLDRGSKQSVLAHDVGATPPVLARWPIPDGRCILYFERRNAIVAIEPS